MLSMEKKSKIFNFFELQWVNCGWCCTQEYSIEVYLASERSGNDVGCSKNDFEKSHFPLMKMVIFQNFVIFRKNIGGMDSSGAETLGLG